MKSLLKNLTLIVVGAVIALSYFALADQADDEDTVHKVVIQVSTDDPRTQKMALNNVVNLQKHYGIDNVIIEVVAYGPGLHLLTEKSDQASRITSLAMSDITFSACGNTMDAVAEKSGTMPTLLDGVEMTQAGVARIMELQEQGYSYVRP